MPLPPSPPSPPPPPPVPLLGADIELGASTPLMEAAQEGNMDIVKFLIEKGANIHAETSTYDTALTYACANGHTIIADILLQCGAELVCVCVCVIRNSSYGDSL